VILLWGRWAKVAARVQREPLVVVKTRKEGKNQQTLERKPGNNTRRMWRDGHLGWKGDKNRVKKKNGPPRGTAKNGPPVNMGGRQSTDSKRWGVFG